MLDLDRVSEALSKGYIKPIGGARPKAGGRFKTTEEALAFVLSRAQMKNTPMGKSFTGWSGNLMKATAHSDGSIDVEGWISTSTQDIEKDIIEPESFSGAGLTGYMQRGAPISVEHGTKTLPVGYLQEAMLVRGDTIIQQESNPRYPKAKFKYFDGGTGWYGMGNIYDPQAALGVVKGTVSSFSWIGMPNTWEDLPSGGRHFSKPGAVDPLLEVTVTGYPINPSATMRLAKAAGYIRDLDEEQMAALLANPFVIEAVIDVFVPQGHASTVVDDLVDKYNVAYSPRARVMDYFSSR